MSKREQFELRKIKNEQRLDEAERIIKEVLQDVRRCITFYDEADYRKLFDAYAALNKVTLRPDSDFDKPAAIAALSAKAAS